MRTREEDFKASAVIRARAMDLFAERGAGAVTVRQIAAAAGVSPGLVMHHFGSKDGLKQAVDRRAAEQLQEIIAELACREVDAGRTLAGMIVDRLDREPSLAGYIRRLLVDGGEVADGLFEQLFQTALDAISSLEETGVVRHSKDREVRAAFLLVNDLALVLLRRQVEGVIGIDSLTGPGLVRWTLEAIDIYTNGLFVTGDRAPATTGRRARRAT